VSGRAAFLLPEGFRPVRLTAALRRNGYLPGPGSPAAAETLYGDTQGGALFKAGERLFLADALWHLELPDGTERTGGDRDGLPAPGPLAEALEGRLRGGRLLPYARVRCEEKAFALEGPAGGRFTLALARQEFALPTGPFTASRRVLRVVQQAGPPEELERLSAVLRGVAQLRETEADPLAAALGALGRALPGAPIPDGMRVVPEDLLALAGRKVLAQQRYRMEANLEGAAADLDPEFVHDLRVATRRARSALRLFAPALGARRCDSLRLELGWAARLSGPVRDLDVFLEALPGHLGRAAVSPEGRQWLAAWLHRRRAEAQEALVAGLGSRRFAVVVARLRSLAESPVPRYPRGAAAMTAAAAAAEHIARAAQKARRGGKELTDPPAPEALHRLRILFKRLRYTCEFFRDALESEAEAYLALLVEVQDCLGAHQDAVAAEALLREAAAEAAATGAPAAVLLDLGALVQLQRDAALARRTAFAPLWRQFRKHAHPS